MNSSLDSLKAAVRAAITYKSTRNWVALGTQVRELYGDPTDFDLDRSRFIRQVILPSLGEECDAIFRRKPPRKGSTEYMLLSSTAKAEIEVLNQKKAMYRGMASVYFNRTKDYAFPKTGDDEDDFIQKLRDTQSLDTVVEKIAATLQEKKAASVVHNLAEAIKYVIYSSKYKR